MSTIYPLVDPEPHPDPEPPDQSFQTDAPTERRQRTESRRRSPRSPVETGPTEVASRVRDRSWPWWLVLFGLLGIHLLLSVGSQGSWSQITSEWPIAFHDHPMHFHNAVASQTFLREHRMTAGYDPYFMAGYPKSVISDPSGTVIECFVALFPRKHAAFAYKLFLLIAMGSLPLWIAIATALWGGKIDAVVAGTLLFLIYLWVDFPLQYAGFGMTSFLLMVPFGALSLRLIDLYVHRGGYTRWLYAVLGSVMVVFLHPLSVFTVAPAAALASLGAMIQAQRDHLGFSISRTVGLFLIPVLTILLNAFWWIPALWFYEGRDSRGLGFFHPEPVLDRVGQIFGLAEPAQHPIQAFLLGAGLIGLVVSTGQRNSGKLALGAYIGAGLFWGYAAGAFRSLDPFEPGRNTYVVYTGASIAVGLGFGLLRSKLKTGNPRIDRIVVLSLLVIGLRYFGADLSRAVQARIGRSLIPVLTTVEEDGSPITLRFPKNEAQPFLSSAPTNELNWLVEEIQSNFGPGDRIFYEEGGASTDRLPDLFRGRRFGGLLPTLTGVEVIGGPFLHVPIRENYAQIGMGKLLDDEDWNSESFDNAARLYGPSGIVCWSPGAREFIGANPEQFQVLSTLGPLQIVRVLAEGGKTIQGDAEVKGSFGRLEVIPEVGEDVDELIILRYHFVPGLRTDPPVALQPVEVAGDPVPMIGLPSSSGPIVIEWEGVEPIRAER